MGDFGRLSHVIITIGSSLYSEVNMKKNNDENQSFNLGRLEESHCQLALLIKTQAINLSVTCEKHK